MTWTLILLLYGTGYAPAMTTASGFAKEQGCIDAGKKAVSALHPKMAFICVQVERQ